MKKRWLIFSLILLFVSISFVNASGGTHSSTSVSLSIDSTAKNPDSISISNLVGSHTYAAGTSSDPGHNANQIWVSVQDGEMTLLSALQSTHRLCPASPVKTLYTSASIPNPSHLATEINLANGKTFQKAINDGDYCPIPVNGGWGPIVPQACSSGYRVETKFCDNPYPANGGANCVADSGWSTGTLSGQSADSRGVVPAGTYYESKIYYDCCVSNVGASCGGTSCVNAGTINCAGTCTGTSNVAKGTDCGDGTTACDGAGSCTGWSGSGCGSCPYGNENQLGSNNWACKLNGNQGRNPSPGGTWLTLQYSARCDHSYTCWLIFTCWSDDSWGIKPKP
jgi:hypothetical protein